MSDRPPHGPHRTPARKKLCGWSRASCAVRPKSYANRTKSYANRAKKFVYTISCGCLNFEAAQNLYCHMKKKAGKNIQNVKFHTFGMFYTDVKFFTFKFHTFCMFYTDLKFFFTFKFHSFGMFYTDLKFFTFKFHTFGMFHTDFSDSCDPYEIRAIRMKFVRSV